MSISERNERLVERFEKSMQTHPDGSAAAWVSGVRTFVEWCGVRNLAVDECTSVDVDDYIEYIAREYVGTTAGVKFDSVKRFYEWCSRKEISDNVASEFERSDYNIGTGTTRQARSLRQSDDYVAIPKSEVMQLVDSVPSPKSRNEALCRLLWVTGIRTSEIVEIRLEDIDWSNNEIKIYGKKTDSYRKVWFGETTEMVLREWIELDRGAIGPYGKESDYVFLTHQSPQMRSSHVSRIVKEAGNAAGVNEVLYEDKNGKQRWKVTGHTLRHSMASYHANVLQTPLHLLKEMLGHSSLDTTMQYVKKDEDAIARSMKKLG